MAAATEIKVKLETLYKAAQREGDIELMERIALAYWEIFKEFIHPYGYDN